MSLANPLRHVARRLLRAPLFTLLSLGTLAVGIGATTAMFAVVDGVLLEPLPYPEPERLVGVWHKAPGLGFDEVNQSAAFHLTYQAESRVFEDVAMYTDARPTITGRGEPEQLDGLYVTAGALPMLGVRPAAGRLFTADDDRHDAPLTAMLSWGYWQQSFGGDRGVIGQTLLVDGRSREIIGVLPRDFRFVERSPALYMPLAIDPTQVFLGGFNYLALGRLRPGATIEQANADVDRMIAIASERYATPQGLTPEMLREAGFAANIRPLERDVLGTVADTLWILLATVGIVLLIACANVANLFLVRAEGRYREVAVRTALGASRGRVARDFLLESLTLSALAGIAGIALAFGGVQLLRALGPEGLPRLASIAIDGSVLLVALAIAALSGVILGLLPVARVTRSEVASALREGGRGGSEGRERHRVRSALVVAQLALALVLLAGSGLMFRSVQSMRSVNPGFQRPDEVLTFRIGIPSAEVSDPLAVAGMHERIARGLAEVPGVAAVGMSTAIPLDGRSSGDPIYAEGFPQPENQLPPIRRYRWITPGFFDAMQTRLLAGRDITWDEVRNAAKVAVVTDNLAREYWGSAEAAVGKRIRNAPGRPWREIVGVVEDIYDLGVDQPASAAVHWPMLHDSLWANDVMVQRSLGYALRLDRPLTPALMDQVRQTVWAVNPNLPLAEVQGMDRLVERSMARSSFTLAMLGIAATLALLLGSVGLYGVISYIVAQRTREFGVRMALGARSADVGRLVLRQASLLVGLGLAIGLFAAAAATRAMSALLFGVKPLDPVTFGTVALGLAAVAFAAAWLPSWRATRVDPLEALRWE